MFYFLIWHSWVSFSSKIAQTSNTRIAKLSSSEKFIVDADMSAILIGPTEQALIDFLDVFKLVANFFSGKYLNWRLTFKYLFEVDLIWFHTNHKKWNSIHFSSYTCYSAYDNILWFTLETEKCMWCWAKDKSMLKICYNGN